MSAAAACAPTRLGIGMRTFAEMMAPPPPPPPAPRKPESYAGAEGCVDPQLWVSCAGSMCTVPPVGAAVYYFPQGHAEHAGAAVDLSATRVPPFVACRVAGVRFMAEPETDDIFARIRLVPLRPGEPVADEGDALKTGSGGDDDGQQQQQPSKPASFAKTLTVSDANNGGGFSVPRFCAETIFPELDYQARPPVQSVCARDVHGVEWTFRHIYRGTPRRHLLTTGWSNFVNKKKLLAGDSVVFLRGEDGRVHVGLRRTKRGFCAAAARADKAKSEASLVPGWDIFGSPVGQDNANNAGGGGGGARLPNGKVPPEDVVAAASLAGAGEPFEVVYYPRASSPEFCVRAAAVRTSMQVPWCNGLRFKMAFETEDSSRISWFMGTISGVQPADPLRWPQSPWRLLQVTWDEPELLQNVKRVCPWLVEQVSSMPNLHMPPPFTPRKKLRIPQYNEFQQPLDPAFPLPLPLPPAPNHDQSHHGGGGLIIPSFPFPDSSAAAGIQGARQAQFAALFSDLHISNLPQSLHLYALRPPGHRASPSPRISTDLTIGSSPPRSPSAAAKKADDDAKQPLAGLMLFGRAILTEEQIKSNSSSNASGSDVSVGSPTKSNLPWWSGDNNSPSEFGLEPGQCKVFVESDAVGRNLDLSALGSLEELYTRLAGMFCIDNADLRSHVLYITAAGETKHVGDEPFSAFVKSARRITILSDAGSDNTGNQ